MNSTKQLKLFRWYTFWLVITMLSCVFVQMAFSEKSEPTSDVLTELEVKVTMRDGIRLSTNIYRPDAEGKIPAILVRTPYGNGGAENNTGHFYAKRGYAVLIQDTRGRFESEGYFDPLRTEAEDGYDTQQWVGSQSWCNGKIGTEGGSYVGFTQWLPAPLDSPYLTAMFPIVTFSGPYDDLIYIGGAFQLALCVGWGSLVTTQPPEDLLHQDWQKYLRHLPLKNWDDVLGRRIQFLRDWIVHPDYDTYWTRGDITTKYHLIDTPVYNIGGWYDVFSKATTENFRQMTLSGKTEEARKSQKLLMGPWVHGISQDGKVGDMDFGMNSVVNLQEIELRWFDYWLKGIDNGIMEEPPVRIFIMGENVWRDELEWPLARTIYTKYYLHSSGSANTLNGDGELNTVLPTDEPTDRYVYDPENPVPTAGGNNLIPQFTPAGPYDQREVEKRGDVLVYTSPVLEDTVEVTGPITMTLYAASSATDTDFTAKLVDVHPDGYAQNLADGIIRARYRDSKTNPTLIEPNKIYKYTIDLWVTSNLFQVGHRIRVEVSSSNFPRFDRNPNTGHPFGQDDEMTKAEQIIYHDVQHPSYILLPVIPRIE